MARKSKYVEVAEELNLIPIMNLVLCLIPCVLFKTQLVKIGMINVSAPSFGPASSKPKDDKEEKPLGLTVALSKEGFLLKATGANLFEVLGLTPDGEASGVKIAKKKDTFLSKDGDAVELVDYDFVALYDYLSRIKDAYKEEKLLTLVGEPDLEFKYLIRTMDVVRFRFESPKFSSIKELSQASAQFKYKKTKEEVTGEDGKTKTVEAYEPLWDQVTFGAVQ